MRLSRNARLFADLVLLSGIVALSFLPVVGTQQTHFLIAAGALRIFAAVYAVIVALGAWRALSRRSRTALDLIAAAMLATMSYAESFPAGNHITEIGIYAGTSTILFALTALSVGPGGVAAGDPARPSHS